MEKESADSIIGANYTVMAYSEQKRAYMKRVMDFFIETADKFEYPHEIETWNVYVLLVSRFGHAGLMFESETTNSSFCIELTFTLEKQDLEVAMGISVIDKKRISESKVVPLGAIQKPMAEIFDTAYEVLQRMGPYRYRTNNCQDYAKLLAKALGTHEEFETDVERVVESSQIALVTLVITVGMKLISRL